MKTKFASLFFLLPLLAIAQSGVGLILMQPDTRTRIIRLDTISTDSNSFRRIYIKDTIRTFPFQLSYFKILPSQKSMIEVALQFQHYKDKKMISALHNPLIMLISIMICGILLLI